MLTYFSNILMFGFLGLTIGFYIIYFAYENYILHKNIKLAIKEGYHKICVLFLIALPSLILLIIFYKTVHFFPSDQRYDMKELLKWLNDVRALIVYDYSGEQILTTQFLHLLIAIFVLGIFLRYKENENKRFVIKKSDVFVIPLAIAILQFFIVGN